MHYKLQDIPGIFATILSVFRCHIDRCMVLHISSAFTG